MRPRFDLVCGGAAASAVPPCTPVSMSPIYLSFAITFFVIRMTWVNHRIMLFSYLVRGGAGARAHFDGPANVHPCSTIRRIAYRPIEAKDVID